MLQLLEMRIENGENGVLVETDVFESFTPHVSPIEHGTAMAMYLETGLVPESYHAKMTSGYLRLKGASVRSVRR